MLILELTLLNRIVSVISSALQAIMAMPDSQKRAPLETKTGWGEAFYAPLLVFLP